MLKDTNILVNEVIDGLSQLIIKNLCGASHPQYFPTGNPDDDDDRIKQGKARADELRKLRDRFEDITSGVL